MMKITNTLLYKGLLLVAMFTLANCNSAQVNKETSNISKNKAFIDIPTDIKPGLKKRITHICKLLLLPMRQGFMKPKYLLRAPTVSKYQKPGMGGNPPSFPMVGMN
jgi:hypothetical protein